jgi:hypothetical protein
MNDEYFYLHMFEYFVLVVWLEFLGENEALNCEVSSGLALWFGETGKCRNRHTLLSLKAMVSTVLPNAAVPE